MRVLLSTEACAAGVARHFGDLAVGLARRGHSVDVVYSPDRGDAGFAIDGVGRQAIERIQAEKIPVFPMAMRRAVGPWDLSAVLATRKLIAERGPYDIVHGHSSKAGAILRLARGRGVRAAVYTPHAPITMAQNLSARKRRLFAAIERFLARRGELIIAVSEDEKNHLVGIGIPARLFRVIPNGVDLSFAPEPLDRAAFGLSSEEVVYGFVGRLTAQKDIPNLIEGFALAVEQGLEGRLLVVGTGEDALPKQIAAERGLGERVVWAGQQDGPRAMATMDVFVLASLYEGFPYVFPEALRAGLPIVTTQVGGAEDTVEQGLNGYIVPVRNPAELGRAMLELGRDPEKRSQMARASREKAESFSVEAMVDATIAAYESVLAGRA